MRLGDNCIFRTCKIKKHYVEKIENELNKLNRSRYIILCISDSDKNISQYFNHSVYIFKNNIKPWHSRKISKTKYGKHYIEKLIGDIIFFSSSESFLISPYSTYGLLGFHIGAFYNTKIKPYRIIGSNNNYSIYDIFKNVDLKSKCVKK